MALGISTDKQYPQPNETYTITITPDPTAGTFHHHVTLYESSDGGNTWTAVQTWQTLGSSTPLQYSTSKSQTGSYSYQAFDYDIDNNVLFSSSVLVIYILEVSNIMIGWKAAVSIGRQANFNAPVKPQDFLFAESCGLEGRHTPIIVNPLMKKRWSAKSSIGRVEVGGDTRIIAVPMGGFTKLLYSMFTDLTTTGTSAPYTHTFKLGDTLYPLSIEKALNEYHLFSDLVVTRLVFAMDLDALLVATATLTGGNYRINNASYTDASAGFPAIAFPIFYGGTATLDGTDLPARTAELTIESTEVDRRVLTSRYSKSYLPGAFTITGRLSLYYDSDAMIRRLFGINGTSYPATPADALITGAIILKAICPGVTPTTYIQFKIPKALFQAVGVPVGGPDVVMQEVTFRGMPNDNETSPIEIEISSSEANSTITTAGTPIS